MQKSFAENAFFIIVLAFLTLVSLYVFLPFFTPILWAGIFSMLFYPLYNQLLKYIKKESIASFLTILLFLAIVFAPASWFFTELAKQASKLYTNFQQEAAKEYLTKLANQNIPGLPQESYPLQLNTQLLTQEDTKQKVYEIAASMFKNLATYSSKAVKIVGDFTISFFIMLYVMYFFLKDGKKFVKWLKKVMPTKDSDEQALFDKFYQIVHSVFKGTFAIAFLQALVSALALYVVGVENIAILFVLSFVLAIIPAVGPALLLVVFAIYFAITGSLLSALFILAVAGLVGLLDNILRPILVGKSSGMHDLVVALSIFGGLAVWGVSGFVLGPAIVALTVSAWEMYSKMLSKN